MPTTTPYKLTGSGPSDYSVDFPTSPITNPEMDVSGGGFVLNVCNVSSSKSHILQAVSAKLVAFTAYTNPLNEWQACNSPSTATTILSQVAAAARWPAATASMRRSPTTRRSTQKWS